MVLLIMTIIVTIIINKLYHKIIKPVPTIGFERLGVEWFACFMIAMMICGSILK